MHKPQNYKFSVNAWRESQLLCISSSSDFYYSKLMKRLYDTLKVAPICEPVKDDLVEISWILAHYFEDVVSGFGLWRAFTNLHKQYYGRFLPFFDVDESDYYQDEMNFADIQLIIWMVIMVEDAINEGKFLNPENVPIKRIAEIAYNLLDEEFEKAPINTSIPLLLKEEKLYDNFFSMREVCQWICIDSYLCSMFTKTVSDNIDDEMSEIFGSICVEPDENMREYVIATKYAFDVKTGPLCIYPQQWLAQILLQYGMTDISIDVGSIVSKPFAFYDVKRINDDEMIWTDYHDVEYRLKDKDFSESCQHKAKYSTAFSPIARYRGQWQPNGVSSWYTKKMFTDSKKKFLSQELGDKNFAELIEKKYSGRKLIYFRNGKEWSKFMTDLTDLKTDKIKGDLKQHLLDSKNIAIFIDPTGISIAPDVASFIKDDSNPYYNSKVASGGFSSLINENCTSELAHYIVENHLMPESRLSSKLGEEHGRRLLQDNLDFIARCFRTNNY
jgi:hypothetical protein